MIRLRVHQILKEQNKTAYWLAKQTGISPNNIGKICKGETSNIRLETMEKICQSLNCTPNEILQTDNPKLQRVMKDKYLSEKEKNIIEAFRKLDECEQKKILDFLKIPSE